MNDKLFSDCDCLEVSTDIIKGYSTFVLCGMNMRRFQVLVLVCLTPFQQYLGI